MPSCQNFHTVFALNNSGKCRMDHSMLRSVLGWITVHSNACQPSTYSTVEYLEYCRGLNTNHCLTQHFYQLLKSKPVAFPIGQGRLCWRLFLFLNEKDLKYLIDKSMNLLGHGESYHPLLGQFRFLWGPKHYLYPGDSDPAHLCTIFGETVKGRCAWGKLYLDQRSSTSGI